MDMNKYKVVLKNDTELSVECEVITWDDRAYSFGDKTDENYTLVVKLEELSYFEKVDSYAGNETYLLALKLQAQIDKCEGFYDSEGHDIRYNDSFVKLMSKVRELI